MAQLIIGYLNKDLTTQEEHKLDDWLSKDRDNVELFEKLTARKHLQETMAWFKNLDRGVAMHDIKPHHNHEQILNHPFLLLSSLCQKAKGSYLVFKYFRQH